MTLGWRHAIVSGISIPELLTILRRNGRRNFAVADHPEQGTT